MRSSATFYKVWLLKAIFVLFMVNGGMSQALTLLSESFESGAGSTPPAGWGIEQVTGTTPGISFVTSSTYPVISSAYDGSVFVSYTSFYISTGSTRLKKNTAISTVNRTFVMVDFAWHEDPGYASSADRVAVQWSTDGINWTTAATFNRYNSIPGWKFKNVLLPSGAANQPALYIAFLFSTAYGNNCALDMVHVTAGPSAPPAFLTIGNGTTTAGWPYYTFYMGSRTQMLYTASQLSAAGASSGIFNSLGFNVSTAYPQVMQNFTIKMGNTSSAALTSWVVTGLDTVYQNNYGVPGIGWQDITLTDPFVWDGTSNVVVEVCFGNNGTYTSNTLVYGTASTETCWHYHADNYAGCTGTAAGSVQTITPDIRFGVPLLPRGVVMGTIRNIKTNMPVSGAIVNYGAKKDTTGPDGIYRLYHLPAGNATISATAPGYLAASGSATVITDTLTILDILLQPGPVVSGTVTDGSTGQPVLGAAISIGGQFQTMSVTGGSFTTPYMSIQGNVPIVVTKTGYENSIGNITLFPDSTVQYQAVLLPEAYPPGPMTAILNPSETAVNLNWGVPMGLYQLIYDDGIQDNFAVWTTANNLHALKFTPLGYPATLIGGTVNLGNQSNYGTNALPLQNFMIYAMLADGPGGTPGTRLDSTVVVPSGFGWNNYSFSIPVTITSGDFFLVMKQGGAPPNAAGIAMDATTSFRSYSKFVSGGGPWVPISGSYMMRAVVQGTGGPAASDITAPLLIVTTDIPQGLNTEKPVSLTNGPPALTRTEPFDWVSMLPISGPPLVELPLAEMQPVSDDGLGSEITGTVIPTDAPAALLYDNGPIITSTGTGYGGADESMLQAPLTSFGSNINKALHYRISDDFVVSAGTWLVTSVELFGYQTGSTTTSSFTAVFCRILNGHPDLPGSTVVWGDTVTNRLSSTSFTNIYRVNISGNNQRPIMKLVVNTPGLYLPPGQYWIEFSALGQLSSGPWCPYVTINNTPVTGDGMIYIASAGIYQPINATYGQGIPFRIFGSVADPGDVTYQAWRLEQGQESNPASWNFIYDGYLNQTTDNHWPELPSGPYRWAVRAAYSPPGLRLSTPIFSNVIGKDWLGSVAVCVNLSCSAHSGEGIVVKLINNNYPDTNYTKVSGSSGCVNFTNVWKGSYTLSVKRFQYPESTQTVTITGSHQFEVNLTEIPYPPTNLTVNNQTLIATWSPPTGSVIQLDEKFENGFEPNGWTISGGTNWQINTALGNPLPAAVFSWSPQVTNYHQYLTSKTLEGLYAPAMYLHYDITLDNFGTTSENNMAVELWNGASWILLKSYSNLTGSFTWTSEVLDITSENENPGFKIRFHAYGADTYDINTWAIDNVKVHSTDGRTGPNPCVVAYNFLINDVISTITTDTSYSIPPEQVPYGQSYQICVNAAYYTNTSSMTCTTMQSGYLYPAQGLIAVSQACNAFLNWKKPVTANGDPPGLTGYNIYENGILIHYNPDKDSLSLAVYGRDPGFYTYEVKAVYDLTSYGFPGQSAESLGNTGGTQTARLMCGMPLPFSEPWDGGSFSQNNWLYDDHWTVNTGQGMGAPCADFQWDPLISNYAQSITSPFINAGEWTCMDIWLDFDYKLIDHNQTGNEKLIVELFYEGQWQEKIRFSNNGTSNWAPQHVKINNIRGKGFKIRFKASGDYSLDILHWYVDNIHVYGICKPAENLEATQSDRTTTLTWQAPECSSVMPTELIGLFQWSGSPDNGYFQKYNYAYGVVYNLAPYPEASLAMIDFHHASWGTSGIWNYKIHVVDWSTYDEIAALGPFTTHGDDRWEKSIALGNIPGCGGKLIGIMLEPMSNSPTDAFPCFSADNIGPDGVSVFGALPDFSMFAGSAIGDFLQNLWIEVPAEDGIKMLKPEKVKVNRLAASGISKTGVHLEKMPSYLTIRQHQCQGNYPSDEASVLDYNIYRSGSDGMPPFVKLNASPINSTLYTDIYPDTLTNGVYRYYVTTRYSGSYDPSVLTCEPAGDTIIVRYPDLHFDPVWFGTPVDPMTVMVMQAYVNNMELNPGDEIAVFDGNVCVGSQIVEAPITPLASCNIVLSRDDPSTAVKDGYTEGNLITYKIWKKNLNLEVSEITHYFPFAPMFAFEYFTAFQSSVVILNGNSLPVTLQLQGLTIQEGESYCFDATGVISVAGGGTFFEMQPGSMATMIAGEKISFLPGTRIRNGAYLHAYISPAGPYCFSTAPVIASGNTVSTITEMEGSPQFTIYPNPTTGIFTVRFPSDIPSSLRIGLYNLSGGKILEVNEIKRSSVDMDIREYPAGIYILLVTCDQYNRVGKIVKF